MNEKKEEKKNSGGNIDLQYSGAKFSRDWTQRLGVEAKEKKINTRGLQGNGAGFENDESTRVKIAKRKTKATEGRGDFAVSFGSRRDSFTDSESVGPYYSMKRDSSKKVEKGGGAELRKPFCEGALR